MSYEYTDRDGATLKINAFRGSRVGEQVYVFAGRDGVYVKPKDAPAVALAILEAAGFEPSVTNVSGKGWRVAVNEAAFHLVMAQDARQIESEREAEDAKVRGWLRIICPGRFIRDTYTPSELERTTYRAARDFFREEKPAPRILSHRDPEPDGGTWKARVGAVYQKRGEDWWRIDEGAEGAYILKWHHIAYPSFPLTEVP